MTQKEFILDALTNYPLVESSYFVNNGIYRYGSVIHRLNKDLGKEGKRIAHYFKIRSGGKSRTAVYFLKGE